MASVLVMPMLICHQTSLESSPREKDGSKIQSERRERERERKKKMMNYLLPAGCKVSEELKGRQQCISASSANEGRDVQFVRDRWHHL